MKSVESDPISKALAISPGDHTPLLALVWLKGVHRGQDARRIVEKMFQHSCGPYGLTAITGGDMQLAWGILLPDKFAPLTCWSIYVNGKELCLFEGDMYDDLPGLKLLPGDNPGLAHHIAAHMRKKPDRRLTNLNGMYSGVYVNSKCAYAFGDSTGTRSLFWMSDASRFIVTGNLWAFRGCDCLDRRWDKMALMEMLTVGVPMAGRTWLEGVSLLQRGRQVVSSSDGNTKVRMLLEPTPRKSWTIKQSVNTLRDSLDDTIGRICRRLDGPVGMALSGGLDSRLFLASLHTQGIEHRSFTFCYNAKARENEIAQAAAKLLYESQRAVVMDSALAVALQQDLCIINEGESQGFGFFLLALQAQEETNTLMTGYPGDIFAGSPIGPFLLHSLKSKRDIADRLLKSFSDVFTADQAFKILNPPFRVSWQDVSDEWYDSFEKIQQQSIIDVYMDHVLDYRLQRRTRPRIESVRFGCLPIYPFMSERVYSAYRSLPLAHLDGVRAHLALLSDYKSGLENLPSANRTLVSVPIYKEYNYRHLVHWSRYVLQKYVLPAQQKWKETKGTFGFGRSILYSNLGKELCRLKQYELFNWPEIQNLIEQAENGRFVNRSAMNRLVGVAVIDDFLFGSGLSGDRALRILKPLRHINFVRATAHQINGQIPKEK